MATHSTSLRLVLPPLLLSNTLVPLAFGAAVVVGASFFIPASANAMLVVALVAVTATLLVRTALDHYGARAVPAPPVTPAAPAGSDEAPRTPADQLPPAVAAQLGELARFFAITDAQLASIAEQTHAAAIGLLERLSDLESRLGAVKDSSAGSHARASRISAAGAQNDRQVAELVRGYMTSRLSEIASERQHLGQVVEQMNSLKGLTNALDQIGSATNILSLNATIEAERAGAIGAGFKVVASEIRNLSQKSRAAVQDANAAIAATRQVVESTLLGARSDERYNSEAARIDQILAQLELVSNSYGELVREHDALMAAMDEHYAVITRNVMDAFGRIQFQDVVRQQVEAVAAGLQGLQAFLHTLAQGRPGGDADLAGVQALIEQVQARYVSHLQHAAHASALGETAAAHDAKTIELF